MRNPAIWGYLGYDRVRSSVLPLKVAQRKHDAVLNTIGFKPLVGFTVDLNDGVDLNHLDGWLRSQPRGKYHSLSPTVYFFSDSEDAALFKLTFPIWKEHK